MYEKCLCGMYRSIGYNYYKLFNFDTAMKFVKQSLQIAVASGNRLQESMTLNNLGLVYIGKSCLKEAVEVCEMGLAVLTKIPVDDENKKEIKETASSLYANLGQAQFFGGNIKLAKIYLEKSFGIARSIGDLRIAASVLINLNNCYMHLKKF